MKQAFGIWNFINPVVLNLKQASQAGNVVFQQNTYRSWIYLYGLFNKTCHNEIFQLSIKKDQNWKRIH